MAVVVRSASADTKLLTPVATPVKPAGVVAGDLLLAFQVADSAATLAAMSAPAGWSQVFAQERNSIWPAIKIWRKLAGASEPSDYAFPDSTGSDCSVVILAITGSDPNQTYNVGITHQGASSTAHVAPSATGVVDGLLVTMHTAVTQGSGTVTTYTAPSGMTERADTTAAGGYTALTVCTQATTSTAATGTKSATASIARSYSALSFVIAPGTNDTIIGPVADTGAGTDTASTAVAHARTETGVGTDALALTVDQSPVTDSGTAADAVAVQRQAAVDDAATGTESLFVTAIEHRDIVESGLGTDSLYVDIPDLFYLDDSGVGTDDADYDSTADDSFETGTGTDSAAIARASATVDAGSGVDSPAVQRMSSVSDGGVGSEAITITRLTVVVDTATGTETVTGLFRRTSVVETGVGTDTVPLVGPVFGDFGVGSDQIQIVDIPFTQILPLKLGPVYDLVVVARIPQVGSEPAFLEVDPIEWKGLTYSNTLSAPQELSASCLLAGVPESVLQRLRRPHELATELWLYRNGKVVFAGPMVGYQTSGEELTINAKGLLAYLRLMAVESDQKFVNADQFTIVKTLVDQWQALPYGDFGIDTSNVALSGFKRDVTYLREGLHNVGLRVEEMGANRDGFDVEVDPASRKLQLWYPGKGVDRSTGEDAIVIDARNITSGDILCSVAIGDLASEAYGTATSEGSDKTLYSAQSNAELRARYGRSAISGTWTDVSKQTLLDSFVQGLLDARDQVLLMPGPNVRVTPDADLVDYGVGDTVAYELSSQLGLSGAFRLRKQSITVTSTGQESADLEFV